MEITTMYYLFLFRNDDGIVIGGIGLYFNGFYSRINGFFYRGKNLRRTPDGIDILNIYIGFKNRSV